METESLARFKMIPANQMIAPGKCAGCGKFSNDDFLDFGLEVEFYGVVYICRECLVEAATVFGFRPDEHYKKIEAENTRFRIELIDSIAREEALRNALASIDTSVRRPDYSALIVPSVETTEHERSSDEAINAEQSGSDEQSDESGSPDVQHDDSIESILGGSGFDI